ncbi:MAG: hypothetical protein WB297_09085 [Actinomycetota bacterium]
MNGGVPYTDGSETPWVAIGNAVPIDELVYETPGPLLLGRRDGLQPPPDE